MVRHVRRLICVALFGGDMQWQLVYLPDVCTQDERDDPDPIRALQRDDMKHFWERW